MKLLANISFTFDPWFWALTPALNVNMHSHTLELEWLCFALYLDIGEPDDFYDGTQW